MCSNVEIPYGYGRCSMDREVNILWIAGSTYNLLEDQKIMDREMKIQWVRVKIP